MNKIIDLWLDMSPYLLLGMFIAGLLHIYLGKNFIRKHLGKGIKSIFKASLFGVPLPVCSCGVIPIASSLRKDGATKGAALSFLISTPTTGIDSIFATYSLLGLLFAIFRPLFAFFAGVLTGIISFFVDKEEDKKEKIIYENKEKFGIKDAIRYGFFELAEDIGKWLVIGIVIGGILSYIPINLQPIYPFDFIIALAISLPLYVCATGSIPIAVSLIDKGFSPGAALIFLIAGPATNTITLSFVRYKLGKKSFIIYLSSIIILSIFAGIVFNFISFGNIIYEKPSIPYSIKIFSGIILAILIGRALIKRYSRA